MNFEVIEPEKVLVGTIEIGGYFEIGGYIYERVRVLTNVGSSVAANSSIRPVFTLCLNTDEVHWYCDENSTTLVTPLVQIAPLKLQPKQPKIKGESL